ncbi:hypothetical protein LCGC14_1883550, partial [marine sediment metagenome]
MNPPGKQIKFREDAIDSIKRG